MNEKNLIKIVEINPTRYNADMIGVTYFDLSTGDMKENILRDTKDIKCPIKVGGIYNAIMYVNLYSIQLESIESEFNSEFELNFISNLIISLETRIDTLKYRAGIDDHFERESLKVKRDRLKERLNTIGA